MTKTAFALLFPFCLVLPACGGTVSIDTSSGDGSDTTTNNSGGSGGSGTGGSGGMTTVTDTGSGGNMEVGCVTNQDCAQFNTTCLVFECQSNTCFAFERDDDGDGQSLCGGGEPGSWDCNDQDPTIYPGADDVCGDLVDNDCDGTVDKGCFDFCQPFPDASGAGKNWYMTCCEVNGKFRQYQPGIPKPFEIVKMEGWNAIFYIGSDGKRYIFPLMRIFSSWFGKMDAQGIPDNDPSICGMIIEYPQYAIMAITMGGQVTLKPFTLLTGLESDPSRWISAPGQQLRKLAPGVAEQLFPSGSIEEHTWLTPDELFVNYTIGTDVNSAADYDIMKAQSITLEQDLGIAPMP